MPHKSCDGLLHYLAHGRLPLVFKWSRLCEIQVRSRQLGKDPCANLRCASFDLNFARRRAAGIAQRSIGQNGRIHWSLKCRTIVCTEYRIKSIIYEYAEQRHAAAATGRAHAPTHLR